MFSGVLTAVMIIVLAYLAYMYSRTLGSCSQELFTSTRSKAQAALSYFNSASPPRYTEYRDYMGRQSNNKEYYELAKLKKQNNLTLETASKILQ